MNNWKFGPKQITQRTPEFARWIFRAVLYLSAITTFVIELIDEIPEPIEAKIGKICLYAVTITHFLSKMFGISVETPQPPDYKNLRQ